MTDIKELRSWLAHAEDDYESARLLARRKKPLLYSSCFHAQQCAEKYLKALLVFTDQGFPKTHDLNTLNTLCKAAGILTGIDEKSLELLSAYAVMARYPGDDPTVEEAKEAINIAATIRKFSRKFLGLK
ncbi:MAG: HEPN domain-containing protein [Anaerolineales bacterium]|nr:HEPN domain-containing protein [Anaerolineales bacterium]